MTSTVATFGPQAVAVDRAAEFGAQGTAVNAERDKVAAPIATPLGA